VLDAGCDFQQELVIAPATPDVLERKVANRKPVTEVLSGLCVPAAAQQTLNYAAVWRT
jgi:hypothetical protein